MEEQRISRMYLSLFLRRLESVGRFLFGAEFRNSSLFPILIILLVVGGPVLGYVLHRHAKFHDLKQQIKGSEIAQNGPQPGGRDPVVLTRTAGSPSAEPEFLSVTLLPGVGMDVLQVTARIPGRRETALLLAPTVQQMADNFVSTLAGPNDNHGAIELPWGGGLEGMTGLLGTTLTTEWQGHTLRLPTTPREQPGLAEGGLLGTQDTDTVQKSTSLTGATAAGRFAATGFDSHWISRTETQVTVTLGATVMDVDVIAKNVGDEPEPLGIGWHPRFALDVGDRVGAMVRLPSGDRLQLGGRQTSMPNGKITSGGSLEDSAGAHATVVGPAGLDAASVHLHAVSQEDGPAAEMRNVAAGYGLRMIAVSTNTREMRVFAPAGSEFVSLGAQSNLDDPFGRTWNGSEEPITILQPGQLLEWKVRLEIFPLHK